MDRGLTPAIAANRFGLGARPGELATIGGAGPDWLRAQLDGRAPQIPDPALQSSASIITQLDELRSAIRAERMSNAGTGRDGAGSAPGSAAAIGTLEKLPQLIRPIYLAEAGARFRGSVATDRPFVERLTQFWANHFAVSVDKNVLAALAGSYEREAIRPYVLGNFNDMLLATTRHPAMVLYLDNQLSMGPGSRAARNAARRNPDRRTGIN